MFAASQARAAAALGYPALTLVVFQNVGALLAIMAVPPKVMMAASVAGETNGPTDARRPPATAALFYRVLAADALMLVLLLMLALGLP